MKLFKYFLLIVLILTIGAAIYIAVQPNQYDVKRKQIIKAPVELVFNNINDFKNWEDWGPWMDDDPTIEVSYADQTSGVGASYTWTSKDGPGRMKTIALERNKSITQELQFGDFEPTETHWTFEEVPEGTEITWNMKADQVPFIFKMFGAISGGMDNMLGEMMEKGFAKMDGVMKEEVKTYNKTIANSFKLGTIEELDLPTQKFIGYLQKTTTKTAMEDMTKLFMEYMPKAGMHAAQYLEQGDYIPGAYYTKWDDEKDEAEFYIGLLLKKDLAPAEGMTSIIIPASKTLKISKYGPYGIGDMEAHTKLNEYLSINEYSNNQKSYELYVNDPTLVKPNEIQTDIYYPVKK
ncbi:SRPBCC family protein [Ichthyenterobacterium sp. W332]|uniref:SRPBCC family protein n=1 Tax=Microcosmobacter mediterraneus TaxID=3075607 RepID=A0ABU2YMT8_9FLAO|nr:SRPBCC family protein [Ichthyenterobacterium sp. W332]MDT0559110.1 SRPBCC family protein [Ichthyenterobacterium sp. W332]